MYKMYIIVHILRRPICKSYIKVEKHGTIICSMKETQYKSACTVHLGVVACDLRLTLITIMSFFVNDLHH